jgi:hypothetical protein
VVAFDAGTGTWTTSGVALPGGSDLPAGQYKIKTYTYDQAGNRSIAVSTITLSGLVLYNTLGSPDEITHSNVGLNGTYGGGSFIPGTVGNAFVADQSQDSLTYFPKEVIPVTAGTIEFDAKLIGFPADMGWGQNPSFLTISDGKSAYVIGYNGNDGAASGGLTGAAGASNMTGTGVYGTWHYSDVMGAGTETAWHHYALVWDANGLPGVADGTKAVAVSIDGHLASGHWIQRRNGHDISGNGPFLPLTGGQLSLVFSQRWAAGESVALDELKIWNYARTDLLSVADTAPPAPATITAPQSNVVVASLDALTGTAADNPTDTMPSDRATITAPTREAAATSLPALSGTAADNAGGVTITGAVDRIRRDSADLSLDHRGRDRWVRQPSKPRPFLGTTVVDDRVVDTLTGGG